MNTKRCSKCGRILLLTDFYKDKKTKSGHASWCKRCLAEYLTTPEQKAVKRAHNATPEGKIVCRNIHFRRAGYKNHDHSQLTHDDYLKLHAAKKGRCWICVILGDSFDKTERRALSVDHDHKTGVVRGLLCSAHNRALGMFGDSRDALLLVANHYFLQ